MASEILINRAYRNISCGIPPEDIRSNLLSSGESEYDCYLAYIAGQVAVDQTIAFRQNLSLKEYYKIIQYEDEVGNEWNLRDTRVNE